MISTLYLKLKILYMKVYIVYIMYINYHGDNKLLLSKKFNCKIIHIKLIKLVQYIISRMNCKWWKYNEKKKTLGDSHFFLWLCKIVSPCSHVMHLGQLFQPGNPS